MEYTILNPGADGDTNGAQLTLREKYILNELNDYVDHVTNLPKLSLIKRLTELMLAEIRMIDRNNELKLGRGFDLSRHLADCEKSIIRYALSLAENNQSVASRLLGIKPTTLNVKIKRYQLLGPLDSEGANASQKRKAARRLKAQAAKRPSRALRA